MNIVYDLRYASEHFPGIGTYAYALFAALVELPSADQFRVLWDPSAAGTRFGRSARPPFKWQSRMPSARSRPSDVARSEPIQSFIRSK